MAYRGRGCLEIRPSNNPFYQTTNSVLGADPNNRVEWKRASGEEISKESEEKGEDSPKFHEGAPDFTFQYTRTSDTIGSNIGFNMTSKPEGPTKAELARKRGERLRLHQSVTQVENVKMDASTALQHYVHNPKIEDPRYTTSSNEVGRRKPTEATFVAERNSRPQGFSASFNNIKPKNSSLNTSITKSNIHPKLDPQFI